MDGAPQDPDDAVVVFRAVRAADLSAACSAVQARGIPAVTDWRPTVLARGVRHTVVYAEGEGELRVPRWCLTEAREALVAYEAESQARIRAHLRGLPRDLVRFGLLAASVVLAMLSLMGETPGWVLGLLAAAVVVLGVMELTARARDREHGPAASSPPPKPPGARQGWFDADAGRKPKR